MLMTANWTLIFNWIIQGLILAGFAFAGVYLALRLFASQHAAAPPSPTSRTPADTEAGVATFVAPSRPAGGTTTALPASSKTTRKRRSALEPDPDTIRHAFDFGEDNRVTMILEMPAATLADDGALVEVWVDVVGWARLEQSRQSASNLKDMRPNGQTAASAPVAASPEHLQTHLDQVLERLQLSADRRGQLRSMLDQKMPTGELET